MRKKCLQYLLHKGSPGVQLIIAIREIKNIEKILDKAFADVYYIYCCDTIANEYWGIAKLVRHWILNPACVGSSPATPAMKLRTIQFTG